MTFWNCSKPDCNFLFKLIYPTATPEVRLSWKAGPKRALWHDKLIEEISTLAFNISVPSITESIFVKFHTGVKLDQNTKGGLCVTISYSCGILFPPQKYDVMSAIIQNLRTRISVMINCQTYATVPLGALQTRKKF